jgi:cysteine desulfurase
MVIYADWNATTPLSAEAADAMSAAMATGWANPSSVHAAGRSARAIVELARTAVAALLGYDARDVVLTSGGTEANNLALHSMALGSDGRPLGAFVAATSEHPSVLRPLEELTRRGSAVILVEPEASGLVSPGAIASALDRAPGPVAGVSLQAVNHETGIVQPIAEVAALCRARGVRLHSDAVQAVGRVHGRPWEGADLVTLAAHKLQGPKGIGALATRPGVRLSAVLRGGAQERGIRPGTQDPIACAGLAVAAARAIDSPSAYAAVAMLRDELERELVTKWGALVNGEGPRAPHVTSLSFPGWFGPELVAALDLEGVCVSSGAACSAGTAEPSAVVAAMLGVARSRSAVRISLGPSTTAEMASAIRSALERVLSRAVGSTRALEIA